MQKYFELNSLKLLIISMFLWGIFAAPNANAVVEVLGRMPGAKIIDVACDTNVKGSCSNIAEEDFWVEISFDPPEPKDAVDLVDECDQAAISAGNCYGISYVGLKDTYKGESAYDRRNEKIDDIDISDADPDEMQEYEVGNDDIVFGSVSEQVSDGKILLYEKGCNGEYPTSGAVYGALMPDKLDNSDSEQAFLGIIFGNSVGGKCPGNPPANLKDKDGNSIQDAKKLKYNFDATDADEVADTCNAASDADVVVEDYDVTTTDADGNDTTVTIRRIKSGFNKNKNNRTIEYNDFDDGFVRGPDCNIITSCGEHQMEKGGDAWESVDIDEDPVDVELACRKITRPGPAIVGVEKHYYVPVGSIYNQVINWNPIEVKAEIEELKNETGKVKFSEPLTDLQAVTRVSFVLEKQGKYACVYAYESNPNQKWRVEREIPQTVSEAQDRITGYNPNKLVAKLTDNKNSGLGIGGYFSGGTDHCVELPPPLVNKKPISWGGVISPVCSTFNNDESRFFYNYYNSDLKKDMKAHGSFTGVIVRCIEETIGNIFVPNPNFTASQSYFSKMQGKLESAIRAVFALYVIFFGYKLMMGKEVPKREEWMWLGLKFALVVYFALGSGMSDLYPKLLGSSKSLSAIFMDAGLGITQNAQIEQARIDQSGAYLAQLDATNALRDAKGALAILEAKETGALADSAALAPQIADLEALLATTKAQRDPAKTERDAALSIYSALDDIVQEKKGIYENALAIEKAISEAISSYDPAPELIVNGDFSSGGGYPPRTNQYYNGWHSNIGNGIRPIAARGASVGIYLRKSNAFQDVNTSAGETYSLSLDYFARDRQVEIYWGGTLIDTLSSTAPWRWQNNQYILDEKGDGTIKRLEFRSVGDPNKIIAMINNVNFQVIRRYSQQDLDDAVAAREAAGLELCEAGAICYGGYSNPNVPPGGVIPEISNALLQAYTAYFLRLTGYQSESEEYNRINTELNALKTLLREALDFLAQSDALITAADAVVDAAEDALGVASDYLTDMTAELNRILGLFSATVTGSPNGYGFCDFRGASYSEGFEGMKLWDTVDCKLAKYLGIGDYKDNVTVPMVLKVAVHSIVSTNYGFPIFFATIIFVIFIIFIVIRVVHIYIMAIIGLALLVYISPLIIPAVLFQQTKSIFTSWLKQLIAVLLQPVILFAFLSFMFGFTDHVMFGGNKDFEPNFEPNNAKIVMASGAEVTKIEDCPDKKAMGCIIQTADFGGWSTVFGTFEKWTINEQEDYWLFMALMKMLLIMFIVGVLIGTVEQISAQLVESMNRAGGLGAISAAPRAKMSIIAEGVRRTTSAAVKAPNKIRNAVKKVNDGKNVMRDIKNARKDRLDRDMKGKHALRSQGKNDKPGGKTDA